ncbi:MAG: tetratricopeptide repeat protein [Acidobacteria bacterium]|nr:tetratricopeptide repeat protein [Acidobacteriota bacterium]
MRRVILVMTVIVATVVGAAWAYQVAARDRDYRALVARGDAALRNDQTFVAIEAYSGAVALRPDSMLAHLRRGEAYHQRGSLDEAARDFRKAGALDPTATRPLEALGDVLYQMQRFERAAETYEDCLRLDDQLARVSYKLALARYREGAIQPALAALDQTIRLNSRLPDAYYLLGLCLREERRTGEAQQAFEHAVSLSPAMIPAREELADLYGTQGRRADELEQLQVIAGIDRDHIERQVAVGLAYARAGQPDLAVLTLGNALERTPDQPLIYGALGRVWLDIAQTRNDRVALSKALEALERIASSPGATSETLTLYGRALLRDGEADVAERTLQQAIARAPIEPTAFLFYAAAAERQNHLEEARQALISYGALVADDPELVARATRIATLSLRLDDVNAAVDWLQRAASVSPNDVKLLASLADAQLKADDREAARATIASALEKDPKNLALAALARRAR